jgi:glutamyl-Q tRNA(Asp) synthetase
MARRSGGRFLVRIEDIDLGRSRAAHIEAIFEDLAWLGIAWEEPVLRQSEHFPVYGEAARRIERLGLAYPCFATRAEIARAAAVAGDLDPEGAPVCSRESPPLPAAESERRRRAGMPFALRLDMARALAWVRTRQGAVPITFTAFDAGGSRRVAARPERWGDVVILRKDVPASYHLAVVTDDARQGVTHVTRGRDLLPATDVHRLLQVILDLPEPLYHHHRLLTDDAGRKLAKSARDTSLASLRRAGVTPADIRRLVSL